MKERFVTKIFFSAHVSRDPLTFFNACFHFAQTKETRQVTGLVKYRTAVRTAECLTLHKVEH